VATLVSRNTNEAMVVSVVGGVWRSLCFVGSLESDSRFCVGVFGRNLASVIVKLFSHSIYFENNVYKICVFNAIYRDSKINCRRHISVNLYESLCCT
jgi:hypothetical protein